MVRTPFCLEFRQILTRNIEEYRITTKNYQVTLISDFKNASFRRIIDDSVFISLDSLFAKWQDIVIDRQCQRRYLSNRCKLVF